MKPLIAYIFGPIISIGLCSFVLCPTTVNAQPANNNNIAIVRGALSIYKGAANTCQKMLIKNGYQCKIYTLPKKANRETFAQWIESIRAYNPKLVVTVGAKSTERILAGIKDTPIVFTMVPNILDASFVKPGHYRDRMTGISSDASPDQRIRWISKTGGKLHRIAIFYSDTTQQTVKSLKVAARRYGIEVVGFKATKNTFIDSLASVKDSQCDGVLMILDARVYNSPTVRALLVWGARNRKPVWAFSKNFVKAGAFAGQFLNPSGLGQQTARLTLQVLGGKSPSDIEMQYVEAIDTAINLHTSAMIDKRIPASAITPETIRYGEEK